VRKVKTKRKKSSREGSLDEFFCPEDKSNKRIIRCRDLARMSMIAEYVRHRVECSMGEIDIKLGISVWTQHGLYRAFGEYFPDIELSRSRWKHRY
jgi:hypothetical protein